MSHCIHSHEWRRATVVSLKGKQQVYNVQKCLMLSGEKGNHVTWFVSGSLQVVANDEPHKTTYNVNKAPLRRWHERVSHVTGAWLLQMPQKELPVVFQPYKKVLIKVLSLRAFKYSSIKCSSANVQTKIYKSIWSATHWCLRTNWGFISMESQICFQLYWWHLGCG